MNFFDGVMASVFVMGAAINIWAENVTALIWTGTAAIWWYLAVSYREGRF